MNGSLFFIDERRVQHTRHHHTRQYLCDKCIEDETPGVSLISSFRGVAVGSWLYATKTHLSTAGISKQYQQQGAEEE